jgi:hypothetical protein
MKTIIPKQDKVKRLLLLQLDAQVPEEGLVVGLVQPLTEVWFLCFV